MTRICLGTQGVPCDVDLSDQHGKRLRCRPCSAEWRDTAGARWSEENKERVREYHAWYYRLHKEHIYEKALAWKRANPDKVAKYQAKNRAKARAAK